MKDISGSVGFVTSLRKYHDKIMDIVNKRSKIHTSTINPQSYASYEKVYYSSVENFRSSSTDSYLADGEYTSSSSRRTPKVQKKRLKELQFSDDIDTVYIESTTPCSSTTSMVTSTPVFCKATFIETATPQKVLILDRETSQKETCDKNFTTIINKVSTAEVLDSTLLRNERNSTRIVSKHGDKNILSKADLDSLKIIQQTDWSTLKIPDLKQNNTFLCSDKDDKFVVNLFESRPSKRWRRKSIFVDEIDSKKKEDCRTISSITQESNDSIHNIPNESQVASKMNEEHDPLDSVTITSEKRAVSTTQKSDKKSNASPEENDNNSTLEQYKNSEEYKKFLNLKKQRDIECLKLSEASHALQTLKKNPHRDVSDELLAEKILLESVEREKLLLNEIRESSYSKIASTHHTGSIEVSNFEVKLTPNENYSRKKNKNMSEFFVLTAAHDTKLFISQTKQVNEENTLNFSEQFVFDDVSEDFQIRLQLFCVQLKTRRNNIFKQRFGCHCCPTSKVLYANVNTCEYQEKEVLKPSFQPFAELTLTKSDLERSSFTFKQVASHQQSGYKLLENRDNAVLCFRVRDICVRSNLSGFLTLGQKEPGSDTIFWERKWCVLNGTRLSIYNYPSEQHFLTNPPGSIDLKYCFGPIFQKLSNPPRKRTFVIKTGHPSNPSNSTSMSSNSTNKLPTLMSKPNFLLDKFYFVADTRDEYTEWTKEIKSVLDFLGSWKMLFFNDEYYEYMKVVR